MKVTIELNPADALRLCIFLEEYKPKMEGVRQLGGLLLAVNDYQEQVYNNITDDQFEDAKAEMSMAELLGMEPPSKNG